MVKTVQVQLVFGDIILKSFEQSINRCLYYSLETRVQSFKVFVIDFPFKQDRRANSESQLKEKETRANRVIENRTKTLTFHLLIVI